MGFHFKPKGGGGGEEKAVGGGGGGERPAAFHAPEISPLTEVASAATTTATLRPAGYGWAFFPSFFPSSNSFFLFPSDLEIVSLALLFIEFFV